MESTPPETSETVPVPTVGPMPPLFSTLYQILGLLIVALYLAGPLYDFAIFGSLVNGESWIRSLPPATLAETLQVAAGGSYHPPHLGFDIVSALTYRQAHERGVAALELAGLLFMGLSLALFLSARAKDKFVGTLFAAVICCGTFFRPSFSPVLVGVGACALILAAIFERIEPLDGQTSPRPLTLFLLVALLVNFHAAAAAAALSGIVLVAARPGETRVKLAMITAIFLGLFANPAFGMQLAQSALEVGKLVVMEVGSRADAATIFDFSVCFYLLTVLVGVIVAADRPTVVRPEELGLFAAVSVLGFVYKDFMPYALLAAGALVCIYSGRISDKRNNVSKGLDLLSAHLSGFATRAATGLLFFLLCLAIVLGKPQLAKVAFLMPSPSRELDHLLSIGGKGPLLHPLDAGNYISFRLALAGHPEGLHAAVDERTLFLLPAAAIGAAKVEEMGPGWREYIRFLAPKSAIVRIGSPLYEFLRRDPAWKLIFQAGEVAADGDSRYTEPREDSGWAVLVRS